MANKNSVLSQLLQWIPRYGAGGLSVDALISRPTDAIVTPDGSVIIADRGNLTSRTINGQTTTFMWNALGQLIQVVKGSTTVKYAYDALGRRIVKDVDVAGSRKVRKFIYAFDNIAAIYDGVNNLIAEYAYGPGIDMPVFAKIGGEVYYYLRDGLGSIRMIGKGGRVINKYTYDLF